MTLMALNHVGFAVSDLSRSIQFYEALLGEEPYFQEIYDVEYIGRVVGYPGATQHAAFFRLPGQSTFLELIQYLQPPAGRVDMETYNAGNAHLCLQCDNLAAEYERIKSIAGATFRSDGPVDSDYGVYGGARTVYLRDPDGISIQFVEIPGGMDPTGGSSAEGE